MKELIDQINAAEICSPLWLDDEVNMTGTTEMCTIDLYEHRWYTLGTVVFKLGEEFFGVRGPVSIKSEQSSYDDIGYKCVAFPMKQIPSVTYRRKEAE